MGSEERRCATWEQESVVQVKLTRGRGRSGRGDGEKGSYWTVYFGGRRAGIVYVNWYAADPQMGPHASLSIWLNLGFRHRGIGTIVMRQALELSGLDEVYATVRKSNGPALAAARKAGFVPCTDTPSGQCMLVWRREAP